MLNLVKNHPSQLQNLRGLWPLLDKDRKQSKDFYQVRGCISRVKQKQLAEAPCTVPMPFLTAQLHSTRSQ